MQKKIRLWWHEKRGHFIMKRMADMRPVLCVNCDIDRRRR